MEETIGLFNAVFCYHGKGSDKSFFSFGVMKTTFAQLLFQFLAVFVETIADLVQRVKLLVSQEKVDGGDKHRHVVFG